MAVDYDRRLAKKLSDGGWKVMKAPSSGSVQRDQPDVHAATNGHSIAFELKTRSGDHGYIEPEEIAALQSFAYDFHSLPALAVRWKGDTTFYWQSVDDWDANRDDDGTIRFDKGDCEYTITELIEGRLDAVG